MVTEESIDIGIFLACNKMRPTLVTRTQHEAGLTNTEMKNIST
uniref:Uncharacterized protein n=1 Tax=Rhizophora mucronata TaxID=61149 RepID=A0A2P2Q6P9_RHIMU